MRGPKPRPRIDLSQAGGLPRCPDHLDADARNEWRRLARPLYEGGILTFADRGALAAYCQAWSHWVAAERKLRETPKLIKTPSGYVQQSPWLSVANKQMELMGRYMAELGITPASRGRVSTGTGTADRSPLEIVICRYGEAPVPLEGSVEKATRLPTGSGT